MTNQLSMQFPCNIDFHGLSTDFPHAFRILPTPVDLGFLKLVRGQSFFKIVAKNLSLMTQIYWFEKQHIFSCTFKIVPMQFSSQIPQYM